jgi:branched-chain amino acid transport system permease protein
MSSPSKERRSWHSPNIASVAVALALFVVALLIAVSGPQYDVTLLVTVGLSAVAAMGLTLLLISGQVSLGQAAFTAVGAYVPRYSPAITVSPRLWRCSPALPRLRSAE